MLPLPEPYTLTSIILLLSGEYTVAVRRTLTTPNTNSLAIYGRAQGQLEDLSALIDRACERCDREHARVAKWLAEGRQVYQPTFKHNPKPKIDLDLDLSDI